MSKISLEGIASKMSANQMKSVTGGSGSRNCPTSLALCSGSCSHPTHGTGTCRIQLIPSAVCACVIGG